MPRGSFAVRPDHNLMRTVTITSMSNENATYTRANIKDLIPANPAKATTTGTTIVMTWGAGIVPALFAFVCHNLFGAMITLTSNGGFSQSIIVPANRLDGIPSNPFLDLRAPPPASATIWTLTITGAAANIVIGEIVMASTLTAMPLLYEDVKFGEYRPMTTHRTNKGHRIRVDKLFIERALSGTVRNTTDRVNLTALWRAAKGPLTPFLVIRDLSEQDCFMAQFSDELHSWDSEGQKEDAKVLFEELTMGIAP